MLGRLNGDGMELEQSQTIQPQINIAITANLITSLKILQLSAEELQQTIEQEIVNNPALEVEERETCPVCGASMQDGRCPDCVPEPSSVTEAPESTVPWEEESYDSWRIDAPPPLATMTTIRSPWPPPRPPCRSSCSSRC